MATRSSWKGCLQLSLVCVPVKAYNTASSGGGEGRGFFEAVCRQRLEGVVAKRLDDRYRPGRRAWIKIKPLVRLGPSAGDC